MKKLISSLVIAAAVIYAIPASAGLMKMTFDGNDCMNEGHQNGNDTVYSSPNGFGNCGIWADGDLLSPVIAKYDFEGSEIKRSSGNAYPDFDFNLIHFSLKSREWSYDQGEGDPGIRFWVAKGGPAFNLFWFIDESDVGKCSDLLSFECLDAAKTVTTGSWEVPDNKGLSHLTFFNSVPTVPVPEPGSLALLGLGLIGLRFARRRSVASN